MHLAELYSVYESRCSVFRAHCRYIYICRLIAAIAGRWPFVSGPLDVYTYIPLGEALRPLGHFFGVQAALTWNDNILEDLISPTYNVRSGGADASGF